MTGDHFSGFQYEYVPDYNVREDERNPKLFAIGLVPNAILRAETGDNGDTITIEEVGNKPVNAFGRACREVQAPGPSLVKVNATEAGKAGPPRRTLPV